MKKMLLGFLAILCAVNVSAKGISTSTENMPLKELLIVFSASQSEDAKTNLEKYSNIRGFKWDYQEIEKKSRVFNSSKIKLKMLGSSEVNLSGTDGTVQSIRVSSPKPTKKFKRVLEANLGKGTVTEMKGCKESVNGHKKSYQISLRNSSVIYVRTEVNFEFEPYMSPIGTDFEFYRTKPNDWKC